MQTLRRQKQVKKIDLPIAGFEKLSLIDWPGKLCSTLILPGCNFRCPYCNNGRLIFDYISLPIINEDEIIATLHPRIGFLDGVCITGGEPLVHRELFAFLGRLKSIGAKVKLDTNGSYSKRLKALIMRKFVNYISMDVKVQPERYQETFHFKITRSDIIESIQSIRRSGIDYDFKTTMVPGLVTTEDLKDIVKLLAGSKRFVLQQFKPSETISEDFIDIKPYSASEMEQFRDVASPYFGEVQLKLLKLKN